MSSSTYGSKQNQDAVAESTVVGVSGAAVVSAEAHDKDPVTEATNSIIDSHQSTCGTSNKQNEDAGQQYGTKAEPEEVSESIGDMNPQMPWNRGADIITVAEILTAMKQGAFEPVRGSRVALALGRVRERVPNRNDDQVKQTPLTKDATVDQAAQTLVAMSLSGTSEVVDAVDAIDANMSPTQPTAVITSQTEVGSDVEHSPEATIVYDHIDDTNDADFIGDGDDDNEYLHDDSDDDEDINEKNDDEHEEASSAPLWLPHLRRKGGKGCREGCKACVAGIRRSEAGAGACDEDGRNITFSRP